MIFTNLKVKIILYYRIFLCLLDPVRVCVKGGGT